MRDDLTEHKVKVFPQPPYSHDLPPYDFWLFPLLMEVHSVPGPSKRGQFTAQMGASLRIQEILQAMDPNAAVMYSSWRRIL